MPYLPHPTYQLWLPTWTKLRDVYEGAGQFLVSTRPYLYAHPREYLDATLNGQPNPTPTKASPKLTSRRLLARYENLAAAIVDTLSGALFRAAPQRIVGDDAARTTVTPLEAFWENADGAGHDMTAVMRDAWIAAAVYGHCFLVLDRPTGATVTDTTSAVPFLRLYTPADVVDWLIDDAGELSALMVQEAVQRRSFAEPTTSVQTVYRSLDDEKWVVLQEAGEGYAPASEGPHGFGTLPVVVLYSNRRPLTPVLGASVLGDPGQYIDLYNLLSETRELLRQQTFGQLSVQVGPDVDVQATQQAIAQGYGTTNVIVSQGTVGYVSPDPGNVQVYHEHMDRLIRQIFRLARVPWEADSRQVESGDSRQLKREDLNTTLSGYADELQTAEVSVAQLVYRGVYGLRWEQQWEADGVTITYPDQFDPTPFEVLAARFTTVMGMDPGETAVKILKHRTVREALPDLAPAQLAAIDAEIDAQEILTKDEQRERQLELAMTKFSSPGGARRSPVAEASDAE